MVTIVTPVYNGSKTLKDCYEDVVSQTYTNWQWILVDDSSSDDSVTMIKAWENKSIHLIQSNKRFGGPGGPRQLAIDEAKGEWIALLDQDDRWEKDKLEKQIDYLKNHPEFKLIAGNQKVIGTKEHKRAGSVILQFHNDIFPSADDIFKENPFLASTAIFNREVCHEVGGFDEHRLAIGRDEWDLWIRIAHKYPVAYQNEVVGSYRWTEDNLSHKIDQENTTDYIREKLKPIITASVFKKTVARDAYIKAKSALKQKCFSLYFSHISVAAKNYPQYWLKGGFYFLQKALTLFK